jgi:hypothetical protein
MEADLLLLIDLVGGPAADWPNEAIFLFRNGRRTSSLIQATWGDLMSQCLKTKEEGTVSV